MENVNINKLILESINNSEPKLQSFEYVDRNYDGKIIQVGMFEKVTSQEQFKKGDRFICPRTEEHKRGILDSHTMKPILLFYDGDSQQWHIRYQYLEEKLGGRSATVAWDLCYILRDDI